MECVGWIQGSLETSVREWGEVNTGPVGKMAMGPVLSPFGLGLYPRS